MALNQLADVVPYVVVAGALFLVAILYGLSRLDATAPLVRGLPRMLLRVITAGIVAALLLPASWSRPVIGALIAGLTVARLRRLREFVGEGPGNGLLITSGGVVVLLCVIALANGEQVPVPVLVLFSALCLAGVEVVLWLPARHGPFVGVLLALAGISLAAVGALIGLTGDGRDLIVVPLLATSGLALTIGGLTLLDATGTLSGLRHRVTYLFTPRREQ